VSGSSSAIVGKAVFEWNGASLGQRVIRHDGGDPQKLPRAGATLARIAECVAWRRVKRMCRTVRRTIARPNSRG